MAGKDINKEDVMDLGGATEDVATIKAAVSDIKGEERKRQLSEIKRMKKQPIEPLPNAVNFFELRKNRLSDLISELKKIGDRKQRKLMLRESTATGNYWLDLNTVGAKSAAGKRIRADIERRMLSNDKQVRNVIDNLFVTVVERPNSTSDEFLNVAKQAQQVCVESEDVVVCSKLFEVGQVCLTIFETRVPNLEDKFKVDEEFKRKRIALLNMNDFLGRATCSSVSKIIKES